MKHRQNRFPRLHRFSRFFRSTRLPRRWNGKPKTETLSRSPGKAAGSPLSDAGASGRLPAVPRKETFPPRLSEVRLLQRAAGHGGQGSKVGRPPVFRAATVSTYVIKFLPPLAEKFELCKFSQCSQASGAISETAQLFGIRNPESGFLGSGSSGLGSGPASAGCCWTIRIARSCLYFPIPLPSTTQ